MSRGRLIVIASLLLLVGAAAFFVWRNQTPPPPAGDVAEGAIKILIDANGVYQLTLDDLATAGLSLTTLTAANLSLRQGETAVPYHLLDNSLIFYGQAPNDPYTTVRPYILETGQPGTLMTERPALAEVKTAVNEIPQTHRLEENNIYAAEARDSQTNNDLWLWHDLPQQDSFDLTLSLPTLSNQPATLRTQFRGVSYNNEIDDDHDIDLRINNQYIDTLRFDGQIYYTSTLEIPSTALQLGDNQIQFDNSPAGASFLDIVQLNWVELTYFATPTAVNDTLQFSNVDGTLTLSGFSSQPLLLDISNPNAPQRLTAENDGNQLTVTPEMTITAIGPLGYEKPQAIAPLRTSQWLAADNQADLIIISSDALAPALAPLVEARQAEGLTVALIPLAELYDAFGHGNPSPKSIQTFVHHAYTNWAEPKPRYLLLVGDATTDYHNNFGTAPANAIPSLLVPVQFSGETISDSRLVDIDDDMHPDLAVGRWPVSTVAEVESLVARTLAYEQGNAAPQTLFAADGTEEQFTTIAQRLSQASNFNENNVNILAGPQASDVTAAWNEGSWLTTYVGHGSITQWGKEDVFTLDAVNGLANSTPPIVVQLTCLSGLFAHPQQTSLSEAMLTHEQGPVLLVAATSLTLSTHQEPFATSLFQQLQDPQVERVGDAFQAAKLSLDVSDAGLREISDTFVLFGDPSARIVRPQG